MPSPTTIDEFLDLVRKSGVADDKKLALYLERARAAQTLPAEPPKLAGLLVRDGLLTHFQAEQFLQGKWRRFTIGKYKVLEKLGAGGMGSVYLCEHKLMRRRVAVKVLPTAKAEDAASLERFYREARAVAALDHPNIVRAYDIDQDEKLHFLVMEHVDGASLQEIVKKAGPMDVLRACHYIRQAALGLQHAHETAGIVHRDIKPGNILVDRNGIVKVLDMGLARFFHDEDDVLTQKFEENVLGTADYLAPEQALDSHSVDIRADIYSLGATFYFCLTGRTPFAEGTTAQKLIWHQTRQPKPVRQLRPQTPEGVSAILDKMMAKDANQRYPTPAAVAEALAEWTRTPIAPPPENEMPRLSPAAMGPASSDSNLSGPRTPASGSNLTARKTWQVSQAKPATPPPTAAPRPAPPATPPPPPKSNPPSGPMNMELSAPLRAAAAAPQARAVPMATASPPRAVNAPVVVAAVASFPAVEAEEESSWNDMAAADEFKAAGRGERSPRLSSKRLIRVVLFSSALVLGIVFLWGILALLSRPSTDRTPTSLSEPMVLYVNSKAEANAVHSISEALSRIRGRKARQAAQIIVREDVAENDLFIDVPNVTIRAEEGKTIRWRPSPKKGATKLFSIHKAAGVRVKGFTLDGEDRVEMLVNLYHRCPGARLENMKLIGFKKYGIWATNCAGGKDQEIRLDRLHIVTRRKDQAAVYFSIVSSVRDAPLTNAFFRFDNCTFDGPGVSVQTNDPATLEHIELPDGVRPVLSTK